MEPTKEFSLNDIRTIADRVYYILGGAFAGRYYEGILTKFGDSYHLMSWAKPFIDKAKIMVDKYNELILSFCQDGETTIRPEKMPEFVKVSDEFLNTKDTVNYTGNIKLEWLKDLEMKDVSILYQFVIE